MKESLLILPLILLNIVACSGSNKEASAKSSGTPLEKSNHFLTGAFAELGYSGRIGDIGYFAPVEVIGEKCLETKQNEDAECTFEKVILTSRKHDLNIKEKDGFIEFSPSIVASDREGNIDFIKIGKTITLTGSVTLYKKNPKDYSWKILKHKLKKL